VVDMLTVGPMARYVQDLVLAVDVIAGGDHVDPQASLASPFSALSGRKSPRDLRVGYFYDDGHTPTTPSTHAAIDRALDALRAAGVVNIVHSAPSFFADATFLLLRCWCVCVSVSECVCMCVCVYVMSICGVVVVDFLMLSFVWHGVCMCVCVCVCVWVCDDTCIYSPQQVYIIISLLQSPSVFFFASVSLVCLCTHSLFPELSPLSLVCGVALGRDGGVGLNHLFSLGGEEPSPQAAFVLPYYKENEMKSVGEADALIMEINRFRSQVCSHNYCSCSRVLSAVVF
jgi:Amidase